MDDVAVFECLLAGEHRIGCFKIQVDLENLLVIQSALPKRHNPLQMDEFRVREEPETARKLYQIAQRLAIFDFINCRPRDIPHDRNAACCRWNKQHITIHQQHIVGLLHLLQVEIQIGRRVFPTSSCDPDVAHTPVYRGSAGCVHCREDGGHRRDRIAPRAGNLARYIDLDRLQFSQRDIKKRPGPRSPLKARVHRRHPIEQLFLELLEREPVCAHRSHVGYEEVPFLVD